ncbi:MAG: hypothetical protein PF488_04255 [Patescibacteria group bacterium]|jgi:hypothetical protein|nr:hypothetical protein [Patescibacteria group bacterium]
MFGFSKNKMEQSPFNKAMEQKNDEEKIETFKKMGTITYQNVLLKAQEILSEKENEKFDEIAGGPDYEKEMFTFLQEKIPNFSNIIKEEVEKTQESIENNMSEEKNNAEITHEKELNPENIDVDTLSKLGEISIKRISHEILDSSEGEEKENFEKVLDTQDDQKIASYIEENYPELLEEKNKETQDDLEYLKSKIRENLEKMKQQEKNE